MDIYDQILENLELERELGTRTVEIDRALLLPPKLATGETPVVPGPRPSPLAPQPEIRALQPEIRALQPETRVLQPEIRALQPETRALQPEIRALQPETRNQKPEPDPPPPVAPAATNSSGGCDIVFLTGRPLSPAGAEAMAKTFAAMKRIKPDIQVALNESRKSRVIVLLGSDALKKLLPTARGVRGKWIQLNGVPTVMTFSPDYIFSHFQAGSPHERQAKSEMWEDIKSAITRLQG